MLLLVVPATLLLFVFTASIGLALSALYVYFRDVKFMVQAVLLVWLYVTPIVYPPSALQSVPGSTTSRAARTPQSTGL